MDYTMIMCDKSRSALDVIKSQGQKKTLTRSETIMLFDKVIEDSTKLGERMTNLESRVSSIEQKVDKLLYIATKPTVLSQVKEILSNKAFLYILITLLCACFGVSVGEVGTFLFK